MTDCMRRWDGYKLGPLVQRGDAGNSHTWSNSSGLFPITKKYSEILARIRHRKGRSLRILLEMGKYNIVYSTWGGCAQKSVEIRSHRSSVCEWKPPRTHNWWIPSSFGEGKKVCRTGANGTCISVYVSGNRVIVSQRRNYFSHFQMLHARYKYSSRLRCRY